MLFRSGTGGLGIRTQRYSTDQAINNWTYASISGMAIPHGVGSVWAQALWEVHWALVNQYGLDTNLYNASGGKGNQRAMLYVNQGMKNTACSPTFLNARDGIIQAAQANYGGADVCLLWQAFAAFGLGSNASTPGSGSTSATNGFAIPVSCQPFSVSISGPSSLERGQSGTFTANVVNPPGAVTYQWSWRPQGGSTWYNGPTTQSWTTSFFNTSEVRVTATSVGQVVSATQWVDVWFLCPNPPCPV